MRRSDGDQVLVVAAGVTLVEAVKAADILAAKVTNNSCLPTVDLLLPGDQHPCDGPLHHQAPGHPGSGGQCCSLWWEGDHSGGSLS